MRVLVTGGAGFIGHHIVEHLLVSSDAEVLVIDKLTYASNGYNRLRDAGVIGNRRLSLYSADFVQGIAFGLAQELGAVDYILHLGAETHVDNSISNPEPFVMTNVVGTMKMLDYARSLGGLKKFIYFSTDEVFGPAPSGVRYKEWDRYNSTNPYSASKAGGEELCLSYANTYGMPIVITHCMNAFGERQHPEKFIPHVIRSVLAGKVIKIHATATRRSAGSRFYIHCRNIASAVQMLMMKGESREKYNIVGENEVSNLEMAQRIAKVVGKKLDYEMVDFHSTRPGHDLRYALDGEKMSKLGWKLPKTFEASLEKTIQWYLKNRQWLKW